MDEQEIDDARQLVRKMAEKRGFFGAEFWEKISLDARQSLQASFLGMNEELSRSLER
jgi:hypothetical protein